LLRERPLSSLGIDGTFIVTRPSAVRVAKATFQQQPTGFVTELRARDASTPRQAGASSWP
jgi:hypothetical protein